MEVPNKIYIDSDDDDLEYFNGKQHQLNMRDFKFMTPPEKLTIPDDSDEERRYILRGSPLDKSYYAEDRILDESPSRIINHTRGNDLVGVSRQVRHLHNRVKYLEERMQSQNGRQLLVYGILSIYFLIQGLRFISRQ